MKSFDTISRQQLMLDVLHDLSLSLGGQTNIETLLPAVLESALTITGARMGAIQIYNKTTGRQRIVAHRGLPQVFLDTFRELDERTTTPCCEAIRSGQRIIVTDLTQSSLLDPCWKPHLAELGVMAAQCSPMIGRDKSLLGLASTYWAETCELSHDVLRMLDILVRQAADQIEYRRREELLLEEGRRKNEFLATLSHELRNPLGPIRNSLYVLDRDDADTADKAQARSIMTRQVGQMSRLVDDLLDISRMSTNKLRIERRYLDFARLVASVVEDHQYRFAAKGVSLQFVPAASPMMVEGDSNRLAQSVGNVLHNAAKFTERGGEACVTLIADVAGNQAVLRVEDTGKGIAPDLLPHVFDAFMQADMALSRSSGGLGLGLSLVRALMGLHGGKIIAESAGSGQGARFTMYLPLVSGPIEVEAVAQTRSKVRRKCVLVVDDNVDAAHSLCQILKLQGWDARCAHKGCDGLTQADKLSPDVVICDIGLPDMNGFVLGEKLKPTRQGKDLLLIALSGYPLRQEWQAAAKVFDHYLVKPYSFEQLQDVLSTPMAHAPAP